MNLEEVPLKDIKYDDEFNCRGQITPLSVGELMRNISEQGLISPITLQHWNVDGYKYRIVCGHRRFMSMTYLNQNHPEKYNTIKSIVLDPDTSPKKIMMINFSENLNRKDLDILQEAISIEKFVRYGFTTQEIAKEVAKSPGWVQVRRDLLKLPEEIQMEAAANFLSQDQIKDLASLQRNWGNEAVFSKVRELKNIALEGGNPRKTKIKEPVKRAKDVRGTPRTNEEIENMMEVLIDALGYGIHTRVLAWSRNDIKDSDLMKDIQELVPTFNIPEKYKNSEF